MTSASAISVQTTVQSQQTNVSLLSTTTSTNATSIGIGHLLFDNATNHTHISTDLLGSFDAVPPPKNLHIVMIGDSLTRYQYMSFVYFLKYKKWLIPNSMDSEQMIWHSNWHEYFRKTKELMSPEEECDCYRPGTNNSRTNKSDYDVINENRYYLDRDSNTSVTYLQKYGSSLSFKSMWNITDVHNPHPLAFDEPELPKEIYIYASKNWTEHIHNFVSKLEPKPKYFVFNEGIWLGMTLKEDELYYSRPEVRMGIIKAISDNGMISVYKTTTKPKGYAGLRREEYEDHFCELADFCLDLSWTEKIPDGDYKDNFHYNEPWYRFMNLQMMELLSLT